MFRKLSDRVTDWWSKLSEREKRIVLGAGGAVFAVLMIAVILAVTSNISNREERIDEKEAMLSEIIRLRGDYKSADSNIKMLEMRLKGNNVNLFSYIEDLAKRMQVDISDMNERSKGATEKEKDAKVKEIQVDVTVNKVTQDRLMDFLAKLEQGPELVKVTKLRMRARNDKAAKLIDANITVSTYKAGSP